MTSVMRAAPRAAPRPRTVRVALVQGGRMVEERVLPTGEHVTVGPTERSTFVVAGLASSVRLLAWSRAGYALHLGRGMRGRIATGGKIVEVSSDPRAPVALDDQARGRVTFGDCILLFQVVEAPAPAPRPELPLAVRRSVFDGFDWRTTCIAAFSFLFHFGAVGSAYADFADTTIEDDGVRVAETVGILRQLPPLPPTEVAGEERTPEDAPKKRDAPAAPPHVAGPKPAHGGAPMYVFPATTGGSGVSDARAHIIERQLRDEGQAILDAIGGKTDGATGRVLAQGDVPTGMLDAVARDARGATPGAGASFAGAFGGGVVHPGAGTHGLPGTAETKRDPRADEAGVTGGPKKPIPGTSVAPPDVPVGKVPDASRVIGGLRGLLRACYRRELDTDPTARGTVRVTATVGPNGEVRSVQAANGGLSSSMVACVTRVVRGAQFGPPEGGSAIVSVPMTFIPQ